MKNITGRKIIFLIVIFLMGIYIYNVPFQRIKAEIAVNKYKTSQNVDFSQIESKLVYKDWTQNGHMIRLMYKDDPGKIYSYHYKKNGSVFLIVYDLSWWRIKNYDDVKYPPLTENYQ